MTEPKYKPHSWVIFKVGSSQVFGRIKGGINNDDYWLYYITNAGSTGQSVYTINEDDIITTIS